MNGVKYNSLNIFTMFQADIPDMDKRTASASSPHLPTLSLFVLNLQIFQVNLDTWSRYHLDLRDIFNTLNNTQMQLLLCC